MGDDDDGDQLDLWARRSDPDTSHDQLAHLTFRSGPIVSAILSMLGEFTEGMTVLEMANHSGIAQVSVSPMMKPLEKEGRVFRTVKRRNRGIVWKDPDCVLWPEDYTNEG
jgi:DNA-binding MarR family transcriptional regulator